MRAIRPNTLLRPPQVLTPLRIPTRNFSPRVSLRKSHQTRSSSSSAQPERPTNFYQLHGRALFKALTLAFLTYQIVYWAWLTLEADEIKDQKNHEIKSLEQEVRLLDESRRAHRPGGGTG